MQNMSGRFLKDHQWVEESVLSRAHHLCRFSRVHNRQLSQLQMRPLLCADASNIIL
ncbi:unnamed protein product, partial [Larinioides sclopetarius]